MKCSIDLYIISGFLGSGKTTFVKKMLTNFKDKKIGILINEFGSIGIDGRLIEKDGIQLVEINNGSIFCSCLKGDFLKTLIEFSKTDIDLLLIENSGMADSSNTHQMLNELKDMTGRQYHYKGAISIVDSLSFLNHVKVLAPVKNQIASSNLIIINKMDLVNRQTMMKIEKEIHQINRKAFIYEAMFSDIPLTVLDEKLSDNGYIGETSNEPWNRPVTYSLESVSYQSKDNIIDFIRIIESHIFRIKGFIKDDATWYHVDVVGDLISVTEYSMGKRDLLSRTKLVIIGKSTLDIKDKITEAWEKIYQELPEIYTDFDMCQKNERDGCQDEFKTISIKSFT